MWAQEVEDRVRESVQLVPAKNSFELPPVASARFNKQTSAGSKENSMAGALESNKMKHGKASVLRKILKRNNTEVDEIGGPLKYSAAAALAASHDRQRSLGQQDDISNYFSASNIVETSSRHLTREDDKYWNCNQGRQQKHRIHILRASAPKMSERIATQNLETASGSVEIDARIKHSERVKSIQRNRLNSTHFRNSSVASQDESQVFDKNKSIEPSVRIESNTSYLLPQLSKTLSESS